MPSTFTPVALEHASRLLNHGPTVLVTSAHGDRRNVMAAAWSMPVEFSPPRIAIVIDKNTFTRQLIAVSGTFGVCIPGAALADLTFAVGSCSGRDTDKFARFGIEAIRGPVLGVPLLEAGPLGYDTAPEDNQRLFIDTLHFSREGHAELARLLAAQLVEQGLVPPR